MIVLVPEVAYDGLREPVRALSPDVRLIPYGENEDVIPELPEAEAILRWLHGRRFSDLIAQGPRLRWLHTPSAGVDHILTPAVRAKPGLTVTNSGPAFAITVSEFVLAWMLMVARGLPLLLAHQRERRWESVPQRELWGQTLGIVGLGPIGRGVATRAKVFGMRTVGLRRQRPEPVADVDEVLTGTEGLNRLLAESDFVVLAAALTEETRSLIGPAELAAMKPSAWLINVARGGLVHEPALITALVEGWIAGACLDVFAEEPLPPTSPLWDLPNVYIAPHSASGWTEGLRARQQALFLDNLRRFRSGEPLVGVVDKERGY